jgi:outer membrane lipoprotein-sorting protein
LALGIDRDSPDVHDVALGNRFETQMHVTIAIVMLLVAPVALGYTAEELVAKNVEAKGGIEKLRAIQSLRLSGKLMVNGGTLQLDYVTLIKRPQLVRYEAKLQGLTQVQAYDGLQAWQINPFQGRKDPEKLSADDAKGMGEDAADVIGALVDYQQKGYRLESLGTEDVDGTEAYKLRVTRPNGDLIYVYLDPDYFLEIRTLSRRIEHGVANETITDYGDYEKVNGVYLALSEESGPKGSSERQKVQFETAEVNVAIDDTPFHFPAIGGNAVLGQ